MEYQPEPESEDERVYDRDEHGLLDYRLRATHPTEPWYSIRSTRTYLIMLVVTLLVVVGVSASVLTSYHHKVTALEQEITSLEQQLHNHTIEDSKVSVSADPVEQSDASEATSPPKIDIKQWEEDQDSGSGQEQPDGPVRHPPAVIAMAVINDENIMHTTRDEFVSYTIDTSRDREFFDTDLSDERISYLARAISPAFVRVGGTGNDWLRYQLGDEINCKQTEEITNHGFQGECMNATWFDNLMGFAERAEAKLIFGLNVLYPWLPYGSEGHDEKPIPYSVWNSSNSAELLRYAIEKKYSLWGLELGNEQNRRISGKDTASHYQTLSTLLDEVYSGTDLPRPELLGPDPHSNFVKALETNEDGAQDWAADFLEGAGSMLTAFTYHEYTGVIDAITTLDPDTLNHGAQAAERIVEAVTTYNEKNSGKVEVWSGEIGNQNHGGTEWGATFGTSLWYADSLGLKATHGHSVYLRQDLFGAFYGLLEAKAKLPQPSYWAAVIASRVIGRKVLSTSVSSTLNTPEDDEARARRKAERNDKDPIDTEHVRMYAFCSRTKSGNIAAIFVNLNEKSDVGVNLKTLSDTYDFDMVPREEYMLTSTSLSSRDIYLNDRLLKLTDSGTLPDLKPDRIVPGYFDEEALVRLRPASYAIIDFELDLDLCKF